MDGVFDVLAALLAWLNVGEAKQFSESAPHVRRNGRLDTLLGCNSSCSLRGRRMALVIVSRKDLKRSTDV